MYKIKPKTLFIGKNVFYLPSCHSTNDIAAEIIQKEEVFDGTVVITSYQSAGRGQRGNSWEAAPNQNLICSIILKPTFLLPSQQFRLNIAISLAITDLLQTFGLPTLRIKWPNDVYIGHKKMGGVLIESSLSGSKISHTIIGIGLNIKQQSFRVENATSLAVECPNQIFDFDFLYETLLEAAEKRYIELRSGQIEKQQNEYLKKLFRINEWHTYKTPTEAFSGKITGITGQGFLQVENENGTIMAFDLKEITYVL